MITPGAHPPRSAVILAGYRWVPPAGFEPALTAPEAVALSPELRGLKDGERLPATGGRRVGHMASRVRRTIRWRSCDPLRRSRRCWYANLRRRRYPRARGTGTGTRARGRRR